MRNMFFLCFLFLFFLLLRKNIRLLKNIKPTSVSLKIPLGDTTIKKMLHDSPISVPFSGEVHLAIGKKF